jgi:hypothetical protein
LTCNRPRRRTGGEIAFLYDLPTVTPFARAASACATFFVALTGVPPGPEMLADAPQLVACVDGWERLFPAKATATRSSAAKSAPLIVFLLGACITESPFR